MKPDVIAEMTNEEVQDKLAEEFESYRKLKSAHAVSPLENPLQLRTSRRVIARLKTEMTKRNKAQNSNN